MLKVILDILLSQDIDMAASDKGVPRSSVSKESACNEGDLDLIPGLGRSPGEGNGYRLQYLAWRIPRTEEANRLINIVIMFGGRTSGDD